ncbi:hypothetical protein P154DRAFT_528754 [Amniculicola lignicola CBS 123094]|uniref:RING-type domain-containing protein n=1 Tax=Amniculicola lignicola CBS 123094 TaxID=1392246 RepID=A0A6A5X5D0_9PLEO|nr:hypothetical protein P154DRAFT_528754 [Amniculicola lignicola CBS 123094]
MADNHETRRATGLHPPQSPADIAHLTRREIEPYLTSSTLNYRYAFRPSTRTARLTRFSPVNGESLDDPNCPICQEPYSQQGDHIAAQLQCLACSHVFGKSCLEAWANSGMMNARNCPICRRPIGGAFQFVDSPEPAPRQNRSNRYLGPPGQLGREQQLHPPQESSSPPTDSDFSWADVDEETPRLLSNSLTANTGPWPEHRPNYPELVSPFNPPPSSIPLQPPISRNSRNAILSNAWERPASIAPRSDSNSPSYLFSRRRVSPPREGGRPAAITLPPNTGPPYLPSPFEGYTLSPGEREQSTSPPVFGRRFRGGLLLASDTQSVANGYTRDESPPFRGGRFRAGPSPVNNIRGVHGGSVPNEQDRLPPLHLSGGSFRRDPLPLDAVGRGRRGNSQYENSAEPRFLSQQTQEQSRSRNQAPHPSTSTAPGFSWIYARMEYFPNYANPPMAPGILPPTRVSHPFPPWRSGPFPSSQVAGAASGNTGVQTHLSTPRNNNRQGSTSNENEQTQIEEAWQNSLQESGLGGLRISSPGCENDRGGRNGHSSSTDTQ